MRKLGLIVAASVALLVPAAGIAFAGEPQVVGAEHSVTVGVPVRVSDVGQVSNVLNGLDVHGLLGALHVL